MAGGGGSEGEYLDYKPTWIVALVCTVIVAISLIVERLIHYAGKFLIKKNQGALFEALQKIKEELMLLGFISLLLTVFQNRITKICVAKHLTDDWLPCSKLDKSKKLLAAAAPPPDGLGYCEKMGNAPLLSYKAVHDLHIFIFVLAVAHVIFSALTILFGTLKIRQWKQWEDSIEKKEHDTEQAQQRTVTHVQDVKEENIRDQHLKDSRAGTEDEENIPCTWAEVLDHSPQQQPQPIPSKLAPFPP